MTTRLRTVRKMVNKLGFDIHRVPSMDKRARQISMLYDKYSNYTMLGKEEYVENLSLASTVVTDGCVIECGVWKGGSSAGMAEVLGQDRSYYLFDSFEGHVEPGAIDGPAARRWKDDVGGPQYFDNAVVSSAWAEEAMRMSGARKYHLVKGWFADTLKSFVPPEPIAVLRVDCDWYEGTMTCLRRLFPYVSRNGILIADGYRDWDGYARAIHQYLGAYHECSRIKQYESGLYYVVKGERDWEL